MTNVRICSKHFVTGKPAHLEQTSHVDWVPSLNGPTKKTDAKEIIQRYQRWKRRSDVKVGSASQSYEIHSIPNTGKAELTFMELLQMHFGNGQKGNSKTKTSFKQQIENVQTENNQLQIQTISKKTSEQMNVTPQKLNQSRYPVVLENSVPTNVETERPNQLRIQTVPKENSQRMNMEIKALNQLQLLIIPSVPNTNRVLVNLVTQPHNQLRLQPIPKKNLDQINIVTKTPGQQKIQTTPKENLEQTNSVTKTPCQQQSQTTWKEHLPELNLETKIPIEEQLETVRKKNLEQLSSINKLKKVNDAQSKVITKLKTENDLLKQEKNELLLLLLEEEGKKH